MHDLRAGTPLGQERDPPIIRNRPYLDIIVVKVGRWVVLERTWQTERQYTIQQGGKVVDKMKGACSGGGEGGTGGAHAGGCEAGGGGCWSSALG